MNKRILKTIIVHALTLAFLIAACNATVLTLRPFGFALHLAVLLAGGSPLASLYFVGAASLTGASLPAFAVSAALGAAGALTNFLVRFVPTLGRRKLWRYIINLAAQSTIYGVLLWVFGDARLIVLLSLIVGLPAGVIVSFAVPLLASGNFVRPTAFECAGLGAFCVVFFAGLEPVRIVYYPVARTLFALFLLLTCKCRGSGGALICGLLASIGGACAAADPGLLAVGTLATLLAALFASGARPLPALALPLGWTMCAFFFSVETETLIWDLTALAVGGVAFVALPRGAMRGVRAYFRPAEKLTEIAAAAGMGRKLPEGLVRTGEALGDMCAMLGEDREAENPRLAENLSAALLGVCEDCERLQTGCPIADGMTALAADLLAGGGELKSRILTLPCSCGGRLLKKANETRAGLSRIMTESERELRSAQSYALRLDSLRRLIGKLAKTVSEDYRYDADLSDKLRRDLTECGLPCGGALVTLTRTGVALVPRGTETAASEKAIGRAVGRVRVDRTDEVAPGWDAVSFSPAPELDVVYAVAQRPRQGNVACGDSYSATVAGTRAMLSLCDGSGTGKGAARLSQTTLSLIESHYRAGFDAADGVMSVNAFLSSRTGEEFSALDVVSVDLATGEADVIKAGSPSTYVLHGDSLTKIDGSALPVGALETASYALAKKRLFVGDVLVLVTDGVSDALPNLPEIIAAQSPRSVRKMADGVLAAAARQGVRDDMSVLAARIVAKS